MFFADATKYDEIMILLVKERFCHPETHVFTHKLKGWKRDLISLLKLLHINGYFIDNKELTNIQIFEIAKNTFGKTVSMSAIAQHRETFHYFQFIPVCNRK